MSTAVQGRGLTKSYAQAGGSVEVLRGVDVDVRTGEFVSVMGPSGSGKSTLLHLLGGLDVPDEGEVHLAGEPLSSRSDDERTRIRADQVGIVYQFFNLVPVLTVEENVALPAVIAGRPASASRARTDELLDLVGLGDHRDKLPSQLSGGQQQRVAIARALFSSPHVILADEPTGNLDMETGAEILELFVHARQELSQSMLMVTHDPRSAARGDRVLVLRDGRVADTLDFGAASVGADAAARTQAVLGLLAGGPVGGAARAAGARGRGTNGESSGGPSAPATPADASDGRPRSRRRIPLRAARPPAP